MLVTKLKKKLSEREKNKTLRKLINTSGLVDFCSNDYLGFAKKHTPSQLEMGGTGSRLISGNSPIHLQVEKEIAHFHNSEAALIFNSGYDANLGFFSCIPQKGDTIIYDQLCHASIRDGIRLGVARSFAFKHNDTRHLEEKLNHARGQTFVIVESVYSMDGDFSPLKAIASLCGKYDAKLVIDEAHAFGLFGPEGSGLCYEINSFARIYTFGKALGSHGAVIVSSQVVVDYLINFSRPFIYTTALPPHAIERIQWAYKNIKNTKKRKILHEKIAYFKLHCKHQNLIESQSAIQCIVIGGNSQTKNAAQLLSNEYFDVRPILHPTVEKGKERLRICLHVFNTKEEIFELCQLINSIK